jgi:mycofactocin system glycosyltransferase
MPPGCQDGPVQSPTTSVPGGPTPVRPAPGRGATGLPPSFGLTMDPSTVGLDGGSVLMGGSPLRLFRITARAQRLLDTWGAGIPVGERPAAQRLARRLVSAGAFTPHPAAPGRHERAVTVVVPVRDRPGQLPRLLGALEGLACVVVDDGSVDGSLTKAIADRHHATFVGLPVNVGPAAARNAGLAVTHTELVAFVDSDCLPAPGWLEPLLGHFDDPLVAAVAPRIVTAPAGRRTAFTRYAAVRSSLDMGPSGGLVRPQSRIPYVPSAALVVRRDVAGDTLFDPRLRGGEDVDLVWRLADAGWDVRYEPASTVEHEWPRRAGAFLARRAFYGTTAAPLSQRHPGTLAPLQTSVWTAAVWALALARRPALAAATLAASILVLARRLRGLVATPVVVATTIAGGGTVRSALPALAGLARAWAPGLLLALLFRRTRWGAALALLAPAGRDWASNPGELDPVRYAALHVADDLAYGAGVWAGCARARTIRPLVPRVSVRARVWSSRSLADQLTDGPGADGSDRE